MTRPFQGGIVGTGGIAKSFAADLSLLPDTRLAGICSRDIEKAKAFQSAFGAEQCLRGHRHHGCRSGHRCDLHRDAQRAARRAGAASVHRHGKAVLVEKPLATSVADAERVASEPARRKCFAMEGMWTRFLPAAQAALQARRRQRTSARSGGSTPSLPIAAMRTARIDSSGLTLGGGAALISASIPCRCAPLLRNPLEISGAWQASKSGVDMRTDINMKFDGGAEGTSFLRLRP